MAAGLALAAADVTGPDAVAWKGATVLVRRNVLRVTERRTNVLLGEYDGVTAVARVAARQWQVTTPHGVFVVTRARNCGCGSRG